MNWILDRRCAAVRRMLVAASAALLSATLAAPASAARLETAAVMAPLEIPRQISMEDFGRLLDQAKQAGVDAVSVDFFWGKIEASGDENFDWSSYDQIVQRILARNLKIVPILSFHRCGGGPGDDCNIPLPQWLYSNFTSIGLSGSDLKYESEQGRIHEDAIVPWATATPAVLDQFRQLMAAFASHYAPQASDFVELNISLGPTGELRYPSYNQGSDGWQYPDRGFFQSYSALAQTSFRNWALDKFGGVAGVSSRWGIPLASPGEIRVPGGNLPPTAGRRAETFVQDNDYIDTPYGRDFIDWYNQSLVDHGRRLLIAADEALSGPFKLIPLSMKIPGVHWQMMPCAPHPRIAEITAGLVQTTLNLGPGPAARADGYGYKRIVDMAGDVKNQTGREVVLHFTAAEMDNDPACGQGNSMAEALVFWIAEAAQDRSIRTKSENALACVNQPGDDRSWDRIRNVFANSAYRGFTLLRLVENGCNPWGTDREAYASFIRDFGAPQPGLVVHVAEWQFCPQAQGCRYAIQTWNGIDGSFPMTYEGNVGGRHWWVGTVPGAPDRLNLTFNNTFSWEGGLGQYDRTYTRSAEGNEIFAIGRQNTTVYSTRP